MPKTFDAIHYSDEHLELLEEAEMSFPYSDKRLVYDGNKHQYIPTKAFLIDNGVEVDEMQPNELKEMLEHVSSQIYDYADKKSGSNIETIKFIIAKGIRRGISPFRFRKNIEDIMLKQARFFVRNGDISMQSGIDMFDKRSISKDEMLREDRHIAPQVKNLLMDLGLTWTGSYDSMFMRYKTEKNW
jgi:hypothetical protein